MARVFYVFTGQAWALKIGGLCLLATYTTNAVLVLGISQRDETVVRTSRERARGTFINSGWVDESNLQDHGDDSNDVPATLAALFR